MRRGRSVRDGSVQSPPRPHRGAPERGQTLAEFALVLPVFFVVLFGLFDGGRLVYANSVVSQAAREGARLAATEAGWVGLSSGACVPAETDIDTANPGAHICPPTVAALKADVVRAVNRMTAGVGSISAVHISCNSGDEVDPAPSGDWTDSSGGNGCADGLGNGLGAAGDVVSVRIEHTFSPVTPIISSIVGSIDLSGSATMVIN
jgi:hypothetical protein